MQQRIHFIDYLRALACFMVVIVHTCEFFYIGADGGVAIKTVFDGVWVALIDGAFRCSVPLFVMISGYLLLPVATSMAEFFRKRLKRVVWPFLIWSILYMALPLLWKGHSAPEALAMLEHLFTNFNDASGHLWFVYMLIGLYLFMPVISPWLATASKKELAFFIVLWLASTFFTYLREWTGMGVYGECHWNEFHLLWYFSGFIGYLALATYVKRFIDWSLGKCIAVGLPLIVAGYAVTAGVWLGRMSTAASIPELEIAWRFCTPNVAAMGFGIFIIMRAAMNRTGCMYRAVRLVAIWSYGIYLMHIMVLNYIYSLLSPLLPTPLAILAIGSATFLLCIGLCWLISLFPFQKWLLG